MLERGGRRYLYLAHEQPPANFSVLDVTDPRAPRLLTQTRLPHGAVRSNSLAVGDDLLLVAYQVQEPGLTAGRDRCLRPEPPGRAAPGRRPGPVRSPVPWHALGGLHRRPVRLPEHRHPRLAAHSSAGRPVPGDRGPDPPGPAQEAGRWWLPGTQHGDGAPRPARHERFDAGFRAHNINLHTQRPRRAYVGYLDAGAIILDVGDVAAPRLVAQLDYHPPLTGFTHTVLPLPSRDLLVISDESVHDHAADQPQRVWLADVSYERAPLIIGSVPLPPLAGYAARGGRFGPHNLHENEPFPWSWQSEEIIFGSFFSAGVRAFDIRDPFQPEQVAAFEPDGPVQINDVYVTADGIVYAVDRSGGGLYILEYSGPG